MVKFSISNNYKMFLFCFVLLVISCKTIKNKNPDLAGNDKDSHGCIGSAGYSWSELLGKCARPWEEGVILRKNGNENEFVWIVFSKDSLQAEINIGKGNNSNILDRRKINGGYTWNQEDDDTFNLNKRNNKWVVEKRGEILFK